MHTPPNICNMESFGKEILINNKTLWVEIQSLFSVHYPFLKIEVIEHEKSMARTWRIDNELCIKQLANITAACKIDISNKRSVSQVSFDFKNKLGLNIEVLRKSGNVWNAISITGNWTLENQNAAGEFICSQMAGPK